MVEADKNGISSVLHTNVRINCDTTTHSIRPVINVLAAFAQLTLKLRCRFGAYTVTELTIQ